MQLTVPGDLRGLRQDDPGGRARRHDRRLPCAADHGDPAIQVEAARAWSAWEGRTLSLLPDFDREPLFSEDHYALAFARIESHYFVNRGFFDADDQLLRNAHLLADITGVILHGRYDVVTPIKNAFDLAQAWPEASLRVVPDSGHAMTEPGIINELIAATRIFSGN